MREREADRLVSTDAKRFWAAPKVEGAESTLARALSMVARSVESMEVRPIELTPTVLVSAWHREASG
jgi:hypothetical protein